MYDAYRFIVALLILMGLLAETSAQTDTTFEILNRIDYTFYVRKPVDSLLHHIPSNYDSLVIIGCHKPYFATELFVMYPNDVVLSSSVKKFRFMNPFWDISTQSQPNWDLALFKKEDIAYSVLTRGSICYVGCDRAYD